MSCSSRFLSSCPHMYRNRGKIESLQNPVPAPTLPNSNTAQPSLIENCGELPSQNFKDQPQDKKESGQGANSDVGPKSLFPTLFPSSLSPPMPWSVPWAQFPVMGVPSSYIQGLQPNSSQIPPEPPRDFRVPLPQPPSGSPPNFPRKSPSPDSDIPSNGLEDHRKFPDRRRRSPKQKIRDNGDAFGGIKSKIREEDAFGGVKPGNRNFPRRMHTSVSPELADLTSLLPKIQMGRRWDKWHVQTWSIMGWFLVQLPSGTNTTWTLQTKIWTASKGIVWRTMFGPLPWIMTCCKGSNNLMFLLLYSSLVLPFSKKIRAA